MKTIKGLLKDYFNCNDMQSEQIESEIRIIINNESKLSNMKSIKKRDWSKLSIEEKRRIIKLADGLYISPMFVQDMYENGSIS